MAETYRTRHRISGRIEENTDENTMRAFADVLEVVGPDAKPYLPEMHRVSLPENPTKDEVAVAVAAGAITEEDAKEIAKAAKAAPVSTTADLEAQRVALEEAHTKDKK